MTFARVVAAEAPHDAPFELVVGGGMSLRIPANFDAAALARLVAVLGRA